ncbi:MAG: hypothetical protein CL916_14180 [Deltaproteobacteria bacterium]|nr:hypothetical protein [Deltaproteobacteria bacterium]
MILFYKSSSTGKKMSSQNSLGLLKDLANALGQQLFFWGCAVVHSRGNLLCEFGLERTKTEDATGSSCYRTTYKNDIVELHGLCVGRYSLQTPSFFYTRQYRRCWVYEDSTPPLPGNYDDSLINKKSLSKIEAASRSFLEWWLEYESWIESTTSPDYRKKCFQSFRSLPKSKHWLPPNEALSWLRQYMDSPKSVPRAKNWKKLSMPKPKSRTFKNIRYTP